MEVDGLGAVVFGGASGIGEACARHLAALGADVTILDTNGGKAAKVATSIFGYSQICDVTEAESVATGITSAMARFGQAPRIVVNCVGLRVDARILGPEGKVSTLIFRRSVEVNLMGAYHVVTYAAQGMMDLPPLETGERGVIINTAFSPLDTAATGQTARAASQSGTEALFRSAAPEMNEMNVRVLTVEIDTTPDPDRVHETYLRLIDKIIEDPNLTGQTLRAAQQTFSTGEPTYVD